MFRRLSLVLVLMALILTAAVALAERPVMPFADYRSESWYLPQSPSVTSGPAASFFNPAAWAMTDQGAADFWFNTDTPRSNLDNYGLAFGKGLGFGMQQSTFGSDGDYYRIYDYQLGLSHGTRLGAFGLGYRWANGETQRTPRQQSLSMGFITRPGRYVTFGSSGVMSLESNAAQAVFDLGIRPFGRPWLTIYGDYTANDDQRFFKDGYWGAGLEIRPINGLHLGFKARQQLGSDEIDYSAMIGLTFKGLNVAGMPRYDHNDDHVNTSYLIRTNPPFPGLPFAEKAPFFGKSNFYYPINLENKVLTYQKYRYFDDQNVAWLDLLKLLDHLRDSDRIQGVAINMAGLRCRSSLLWEMRQKIEEIQGSGKEVVVHLDRAGAGLAYVAMAADRVTMDPYGGLTMPGLSLTRTYVKGTLEKLGLGFQEHRYFKYKSAVEALSRENMSEADREQRQRIVDVIYETLYDGMAESRNLSPEQMDYLVDNLAELTAQEALDNQLIDEITRWDKLGKWLHDERRAAFAPPELIQRPRDHMDQQWGPLSRIPVVYAVGVCDMDTGIKGRQTSAYLRSLVNDPTVVAVVLRADSPGGDPLPSDLITDAVKQLKAAGKPVIISQGDVAASGGYWISMEGSEILTTPLTVTGSIGVISGWLYNDGLAEKAGFSSDTVQRGAHSDLYSGVNFPFVGKVPTRPRSEEELQRVEKIIRAMYDDFVAAVAVGRELSVDQVGEVAQGRVWMGGDAIEHGLCDQYGSLSDAIDLARERSGIQDWRQVQVVEYPPRPMFKMPSFMPGLPSLMGLGDKFNAYLQAQLVPDPSSLQDDPSLDPLYGIPAGFDPAHMLYLRNLNQAAGQPVMMVSPDLLPDGWRKMD